MHRPSGIPSNVTNWLTGWLVPPVSAKHVLHSIFSALGADEAVELAGLFLSYECCLSQQDFIQLSENLFCFFCCAAGVVAGAEAIDNRCCLISPWMLFLFYSQKKIVVYPSPWDCMLRSVLLLEDMVQVKRTKTSKTTTGHGRKSRLSLATTKSKLLHCGRARLPDEDADRLHTQSK